MRRVAKETEAKLLFAKQVACNTDWADLEFLRRLVALETRC